MGRLLLFLLLVLTGCAGLRHPRPASATAITNVTLIDGRGGAARPGATILVRDGIIHRVSFGRARVPTGFSRIDGAGGYLLPGFIDMHAHLLVPRCEPPAGQNSPFDRGLSERMLSALLDFGITTVTEIPSSCPW